MRSYRPEELFDDDGRLIARAGRAGAPRATGAWAPTPTPTAACCSGTCACPTSADYAVEVAKPGTTTAEATRVLGGFLRDVMAANLDAAQLPGRSAPTRRRPTGSTRCSR